MEETEIIILFKSSQHLLRLMQYVCHVRCIRNCSTEKNIFGLVTDQLRKSSCSTKIKANVLYFFKNMQ